MPAKRTTERRELTPEDFDALYGVCEHVRGIAALCASAARVDEYMEDACRYAGQVLGQQEEVMRHLLDELSGIKRG